MEANGVYQYAEPYRFVSARLRRPSAEAGLPAREHLRARAPGERYPAVPQGLVVGDALRWRGHGVEQLLPLEMRIGAGHLSGRATETPTGPSPSWKAELDSPGTRQRMQLHRFFEALPWYRLVPAGPSTGGPRWSPPGSASGRTTSRQPSTREGDLVVAYVPPTGCKAPTVRAGPVAAPRPGASPVVRSGRRGLRRCTARSRCAPGKWSFEVPGKNASGLDDWALRGRGAVTPACGSGGQPRQHLVRDRRHPCGQGTAPRRAAAASAPNGCRGRRRVGRPGSPRHAATGTAG